MNRRLPVRWKASIEPTRPPTGAAGAKGTPLLGSSVSVSPATRGGAVRVVPLLAALLAGGCSTLNAARETFLGGPAPGDAAPARLTGFIGAAVADEPRAALAAREVLALGGTAADAAVALAFTLAVTLPSRASLGAGGACLAYNPSRDGPGAGAPEAILFTPVPGGGAPGADRPAAAPMLPRGMFALHARYGRQPLEGLIAPAEQLARFGAPISRALVRDLSLVAGPLRADPASAAIFAPGGIALTEGSQLVQPDLGATLAQLRTAGVGDLYQGALARRVTEASVIAGGGLTLEAMRAALPRTAAPIVLSEGRDQVAFLPPPADGGLAAAAAFTQLQANPADLTAAQARAEAVAARWRAGGGETQALLASAGGGFLPPLGAGTSFATLDREGNAVVCALSMNNLFGTGRTAPGTGVVLASSPGATPPALLPAALAWNPNVRGFRAAVAGSGQAGGPLGVAAGMLNALRSGEALPVPAPEPGRSNAIACARYLPGEEGDCRWATDPRGAGLAAGSN